MAEADTNQEVDFEVPVDLAVMLGARPGKRTVVCQSSGITLSSERTSSGGLVLFLKTGKKEEPVAVLDSEDVQEFQAELEKAKKRGAAAEGGLRPKLHGHKGHKCRPTVGKINCGVRRCYGGKNIRHVFCRRPIPLVKRFVCLCND